MDKLRPACMAICEALISDFDLSGFISHKTGEEQLNRSQMDNSILRGCGRPIFDLIRRQASLILQNCGAKSLILRRLEDLMSLANSKFYAYPFKDVPECWRQLFTDASILSACAIVVYSQAADAEDALIDKIIEILDLALIMSGAPGTQRREWIERIIDLLQPLCSSSNVESPRAAKRTKLNDIDKEDLFPNLEGSTPDIMHRVARLSSPSLLAFEKLMQHPRNQDLGPEPCVIEKAIEHWPARNERSWKKPSYILSKTLGGRRLIPIEVGRSYVDEGWGQKIIKMKDFIGDYLLQEPGKRSGPVLLTVLDIEQSCFQQGSGDDAQDSGTGYLAQHDLFNQIPSLRGDITIPDYCYTVPSPPHPSSPLASKHSAMPKLEEPLLNAWFGPRGTISPMHVDPYHNILAQVVGKKYVRLYAPKESEKLYARGIESGGVDMSNTSAVDIGVLEGWDGTKADREEAASKYPLYREAEFVDLVLEEGECLYIPLGWWHYVRSLTVSFSEGAIMRHQETAPKRTPLILEVTTHKFSRLRDILWQNFFFNSTSSLSSIDIAKIIAIARVTPFREMYRSTRTTLETWIEPPCTIPWHPSHCLETSEMDQDPVLNRATEVRTALCGYISALRLRVDQPPEFSLGISRGTYSGCSCPQNTLFFWLNTAVVLSTIGPIYWIMAQAYDATDGHRYRRCWQNIQTGFPYYGEDLRVLLPPNWTQISERLLYNTAPSFCKTPPVVFSMPLNVTPHTCEPALSWERGRREDTNFHANGYQRL